MALFFKRSTSGKLVFLWFLLLSSRINFFFRLVVSKQLVQKFQSSFIDKIFFYLLRKTDFICRMHTNNICPTLHKNIIAYLCSIKARIFSLDY